jgi:hypothetical protein
VLLSRFAYLDNRGAKSASDLAKERRSVLKILTILFVLTITFSAQAVQKKLLLSYLQRGPNNNSLNVAILSENMVVQNVYSETLPMPGGLTSIHLGDAPGEFSIYFNSRIFANGPIKIKRVDFETDGNSITVKDRKTLTQKSNSLLNLDVNDGIGSVQRTNNTVDRFTLNQDLVQEFRNISRDTLPGQPYSSSQIRLLTPSGTNEFHGSLFFFQRNGATSANVFFNNVENGVKGQPKLAQFIGSDQPRSMIFKSGCGRLFFFSTNSKTSPQGNAQIGHKRQELSTDFQPIGQNAVIDQFRDHRNPDLTYFKTLGIAIHNYQSSSCRQFPVFDRFNNGKNANELWGSRFNFTETSGPTRSMAPKRLNVPIPNNSATYGADIEGIELP